MSNALGFEVEWFDPVARLLRTLYLRYFLDDCTVEILQEKNFLLKRIFYGDVTVADLFVGNSVTIYNRLLVIKKYANAGTDAYMSNREVHFLASIDSSMLNQLGRIFNLAKDNRLRSAKIRSTSGSQTYLEFVSYDGNRAPAFIAEVERYGSCSIVSPEDIRDVMSSGQVQITGPCTLCIIKPHIIKELQAGNLLSSIVDAGFTIGAAFSFHFSKDIANELLDVYRQIYRPYSAMLDHLCSYPSLIIAVYGNDFVVEDFRQLCGPLNPEIARTLRPASLRARFGKDLAQNAVHCTDLVEDGEMECNYVFQTIASM